MPRRIPADYIPPSEPCEFPEDSYIDIAFEGRLDIILRNGFYGISREADDVKRIVYKGTTVYDRTKSRWLDDVPAYLYNGPGFLFACHFNGSLLSSITVVEDPPAPPAPPRARGTKRRRDSQVSEPAAAAAADPRPVARRRRSP